MNSHSRTRRIHLRPPDPELRQIRPRHWRMGLVTDRTGHVHLGVVIAGDDSDAPVYTDLLTGVGAASIAEIDLARLTILAQGEHIEGFRRLVDRTIADSHLRGRLLDLIELTSTRD